VDALIAAAAIRANALFVTVTLRISSHSWRKVLG